MTKEASAPQEENVKDEGFLSRLKELVGDEKPFHWATEVGISKGAFDRIWNKETVPSAELLVRIQKATGVSIDWLLTGEGPVRKWDDSDSIEPVLQAIAEVMTSEDAGMKKTFSQALVNTVYGFRGQVRQRKVLADLRKDVDMIKARLFGVTEKLKTEPEGGT